MTAQCRMACSTLTRGRCWGHGNPEALGGVLFSGGLVCAVLGTFAVKKRTSSLLPSAGLCLVVAAGVVLLDHDFIEGDLGPIGMVGVNAPGFKEF